MLNDMYAGLYFRIMEQFSSFVVTKIYPNTQNVRNGASCIKEDDKQFFFVLSTRQGM